MDRKKQIIRLINYTQTCMKEFANQIPDEQRKSTGQPDHWTAKDHLAHIAHWKSIFNHRLQKRDKLDKPVTDIDKENARVFEINKNKSWDDVIKMMDTADQDMCHQIRLISEEELNSTTIMPGLQERPLWRALVSDGCTHALSHLGQLYIEAGQPEKSLEMLEKIMEDLQSLDESHKWQGTIIYNLACGYATAGKSEKAIELLKESLQLNPELIGWSTHDPDFNSVREMEEYKNLYPNPV